MCSCNFVIISWCKKVLPFHLKELKSYSTGMGSFLLSLVEIGRVVLKKIFLCPLFRNYLRMEKEGALNWNNIESLSQKDNLAKLVYIAQWFWRRRFFKMCHWFFPKSLFFPFERDGALHLNKLESPSPNDSLGEVWLKLPTGSGEDDFFKFVNGFLIFFNYLHVEINGVLYLKKLNTLH